MIVNEQHCAQLRVTSPIGMRNALNKRSVNIFINQSPSVLHRPQVTQLQTIFSVLRFAAALKVRLSELIGNSPPPRPSEHRI